MVIVSKLSYIRWRVCACVRACAWLPLPYNMQLHIPVAGSTSYFLRYLPRDRDRGGLIVRGVGLPA